MPLVLLSIAGMGILYSLLPDDMTKRVIKAGVCEICEPPHMEFELGVLPEADAVIKAANEGFIKALEEGIQLREAKKAEAEQKRSEKE